MATTTTFNTWSGLVGACATALTLTADTQTETQTKWAAEIAKRDLVINGNKISVVLADAATTRAWSWVRDSIDNAVFTWKLDKTVVPNNKISAFLDSLALLPPPQPATSDPADQKKISDLEKDKKALEKEVLAEKKRAERNYKRFLKLRDQTDAADPTKSKRVRRPTGTQKNVSSNMTTRRNKITTDFKTKMASANGPDHKRLANCLDDLTTFYSHTTDNIMTAYLDAADAIISSNTTIDDATAEVFIENWAKWGVGEGDQGAFEGAVTDKQATYAAWRESMENKIWLPVWQEWSEAYAKEAAEDEEARTTAERSLGGYLTDTLSAWTSFVKSGWSGGFGSKVLCILKAPLAVIGLVGSMAIDVIAKPLTGTTINRYFAENQGLTLTVLPKSGSAAGTSSSGKSA